VAPQNKFNVARHGHGSQQQHRVDGTGLLECWTCRKRHLKRNCPHNQCGRPQIYSAQEAKIVGYVGQTIPHIYAALDNRQVDHQAFIIEIDGKLCDQVVSILIGPGSNYIYVSPDFVNKCGLNKEVYVESWLVQLATGT